MAALAITAPLGGGPGGGGGISPLKATGFGGGGGGGGKGMDEVTSESSPEGSFPESGRGGGGGGGGTDKLVSRGSDFDPGSDFEDDGPALDEADKGILGPTEYRLNKKDIKDELKFIR